MCGGLSQGGQRKHWAALCPEPFFSGSFQENEGQLTQFVVYPRSLVCVLYILLPSGILGDCRKLLRMKAFPACV